MQTVQPLSARPAQSAPQTDKGEQATPASDLSSFRSTMEKAERKATAPEEPKQGGEAISIPEAGMEAGNALALATMPEAAALQGEGEGIDALLPLMQAEEKQPGEDVPAENEAQMAILAALFMQSAGEPQAEPPVEMEMEQQAPQEQQAIPVQTIQLPIQTAETQWQPAAVSQEGERELPKTEKPIAQAAVLPEQENILPREAPAPAATMAQTTQQQPEERNTNELPLATPENRRETPALELSPMAEIPQHPVADITAPGGEDLPAPAARQALTDSLFEQVQTAVSTGKEELFVQLKPESLGGLVIHLSMTEEGLKAQVRTSSENVQNLVTGQIAQLEDALRARDIPVVQMDVIYDQSAGSGFLNQQRHAWQESGGWGKGTHIAPLEETAGLYEAALATAPSEEIGEAGVVYSA